MRKAILAVRENKMGFLKAAKTFGVPRSTLYRLSREKNKPVEEITYTKMGRKSTFPVKLETDLTEYILHMESSGFRLTQSDIMTLAYQLAEKNKLIHTFSRRKQSAGKRWLYLFLRRHPEFSLRRTTAVGKTKSLNKDEADGFFTFLETALDKNKYTANSIYCVGETAVSIVPSKMPEVLSKKLIKRIAATKSSRKGSIVTCVLCMNASGIFVPPLMIFPREQDDSLLLKGAPLGAVHACHPSGRIQTDLFTKWFKHFLNYVRPSAAMPVLLLLEGRSQYTRNIELFDLARKNHVQLLSLPSHSRHNIQPLDRTFMGPFEEYFTEEIRHWAQHTTNTATHYEFSELFGRAYLKTQRADIAINGFRETGIYPVDRSVIQD